MFYSNASGFSPALFSALMLLVVGLCNCVSAYFAEEYAAEAERPSELSAEDHKQQEWRGVW